MSHNTGSITSVLKIRLELDRSNFKLSYDIIKVHFASLLIELLTPKPAGSF